MGILQHRLPRVYSPVGSKLPRPRRTFGVGLVDFPDGPYDDEAPEAPLSAYHEPTADDGHAFWTEELSHLESLLPHATPSRRAEIEGRMDAVLGMLGLPAPARKPRPFEPSLDDRLWWTLETERLAAESLERQMAAAWVMAEIEAGAKRHDGRDSWEEQEACRVEGGRR